MSASEPARRPSDAERPPAICPSCGAPLPDEPYDQPVPSPPARWLRRIGVALLPIMAVVYLGLRIAGTHSLGFGTGAGYLAVAFITAPSLALYAVSRLLPTRRRVFCLRCSWNEEYPAVRPTSGGSDGP